MSEGNEGNIYLSKRDVRDILPHRWPWLLIDEAIHSEEKTWTIKKLSFFDLLLMGHFPGNRVMPGVVSLECLNQVAAICARMKFPDISGLPFSTGLDGIKFRTPARPGDSIKITVKLTKARHPFYYFSGKVTSIDGIIIAEVKEIKGCAAEEKAYALNESIA